MCKNPASPYLVGFAKSGKKALVFKSNCDTWECEECASRKKSQWSARAILGCQELRSRGEIVHFVTLTSHERLKTFAATHAAFPSAWSKLYKRMKRRTPAMMYLMICEQHKLGGRLHVHFLTNHDDKTRWYKDNARACGLGFQAKVELIENDGKAAAYVSKYIGKSLGGERLPSHFRRVRCSQNWAPLAQLEGNIASGDFDWVVCNTTTSLWAATEQCQAEKRTMIDGATGEYFDYQDAIETWYH